MNREVDLVSLVGGLAIAALGTVLLLDETGAIELTVGWFLALLCATLGAILAVSGLAARGR